MGATAPVMRDDDRFHKELPPEIVVDSLRRLFPAKHLRTLVLDLLEVVDEREEEVLLGLPLLSGMIASFPPGGEAHSWILRVCRRGDGSL